MKKANDAVNSPEESFQIVHKKLTEQHEVDALKMAEQE